MGEEEQRIMQFDKRKTGLSLVGHLPWGSHFCQFYQTEQDLLDLLVPYFQAGLKSNELCLWVTAGSLAPGAARQALEKAVPHWERVVEAGQMEIVSPRRWQARGGKTDAAITAMLDLALARGFDGLRLACPAVPEKRGGKTFACPGAEFIGCQHVLAAFAYPRARFDALGLMEVVKNHRFALVRNGGRWEVIESSQALVMKDSLKRSEEKLQSLFSNMSEGFAYHRLVLDGAGRPCDFVFLETNAAFETLTGLKGKDIIGRRVTEVLPGIERDPADWIGRYGQVALTGKPARFESYAEPLKRWYAVSAFSPHKGFFAVTINEITERKREEQEREISMRFLQLVNERHGTGNLVRAALDFFVEQSGCEAAGVRLKEGEDYPYYETRGFAAEFARAESGLCARDCAGRPARDGAGHPVLECLCGSVICRRFDPVKAFLAPGGSFWTNDLSRLLAGDREVERQAAARNLCHDAGYESLALLPLRAGGECVGLLQLNDRRKGRFTPETLALWERLADYLAVALAKTLAEEELKRQREWLRVTLTSIGDGVITCDTAGRVTFLNAVAEKISGWESGEALGQPIRGVFNIINEQTRQPAEDIVGRVLREKCIIELANHTALLARDGREVPIEDSAAPIMDSAGSLAGVVLVFHDVTQQRGAREELRLANEHLAEADRRKDEFLAMLAHELRNPLAPIRNAVQILKLAGANEPVREKNREIIERQASHMGRLLDDLLDVSRVTRGKIALKLEPLDLRTIVLQAVEVAATAAQARRLELRYANPAAPVWLEGDFTRLEQVVGNLINNAIKYTDAGRIEVSLACEAEADGAGRRAVVRVADTGIGITAEVLPRVFELFAQADQSLERTRGGLGIGLTMVKRLVGLHGGRVEARSGGLGQGSEFAVLLPLLESLRPEETPDGRAAPAWHGQAGAPLKVLVVDDNQDAADSLKELLAMWGYEARMAFDGPEAVQLALTFLPDVILLDIGLPGMSGYAVARRLREERALESARIIALTGYGQEEDRKMTSESGCDAHLVKPVDLQQLKALLARIDVGA